MVYILLIAFAILSRFVPHVSNAAAISALAIFAGSYLPKKQAVVLPLAARLITDAVIGFFAWPQMIAVYGAHLFGLLLGFWIKSAEGKKKWARIFVSGFGSSILFYVITNFAFLYPEPQYMHNWSGIVLSYTNGLPFLRGTILGDVGYVVLLFGAYDLASYLGRKRAQIKLAEINA